MKVPTNVRNFLLDISRTTIIIAQKISFASRIPGIYMAIFIISLGLTYLLFTVLTYKPRDQHLEPIIAILSTHQLSAAPTIKITLRTFGVWVPKSDNPNTITVAFYGFDIDRCRLLDYVNFRRDIIIKPVKRNVFKQSDSLTKEMLVLSFDTKPSSDAGFSCSARNIARSASFATMETGISFLSATENENGKLSDQPQSDAIMRYYGPVRVSFEFPFVTDFTIEGGTRPSDAQEGERTVELPQNRDASVFAHWSDESRRDLRDLLLLTSGTILGLSGAALLEFIKYYAARSEAH